MVRLRILATLTDIDGNPLPNKTIEFYVSTDDVNYTLIDTKTTDSNGVAETTYEVMQYGTYYFKARFPGDETYDASEAKASYTYGFDWSQLLQQIMNLLPYLIMILIIVLVISLIVSAFRD